MASNSPVPDGSSHAGSHAPHVPYNPQGPYAAYGQAPAAGPEEWNPGEDSAPAARGRHRVAKQRGGSMARSGAVLGVGVIAAVGAGGMASAQDRPAAPISVPDVPDLKELPEMAGKLLGVVEEESPAPAASREASEPVNDPASAPALAQNAADAGEALRARILQQAEHQQDSAEEAARESEAKAAEDAHRKTAAEETAKAKAQEQAEENQQAPQAGDKAEGKAADAAGPETQKPAAPSRSEHGSYVLPVGSYTLTAGFGQSGNMWSANHTGEDFAAPTGTPVKAVGGGTITQAGWAGAYGYRIVLTQDDGTELWFCHLSSMVVTSGKVAAGDVIGRVGATGNVTGPHLHLEVRPGGGGPVDPLPWLRDKGLQP
ncbi:peptidoglycan DD-metalloendopeptidase family protein [Streptomyces sp. ET3-23]|uniref:peptidoglycan DD-metalloendopeptidase family protein n=1 Tax=Streptomyces sp. ET3-23 TaxID=2885643 RepID=UPI001D11380E|nr:peptidoglycan DD-metalloendopeptidase family protein [Streptomyces sp. ET3-23]MCC2275186.1 peptidoglycan DD-metalloendopeptidase family protein [Streptomyces sp. ET3-23]